jgi:hypothetical protein
MNVWVFGWMEMRVGGDGKGSGKEAVVMGRERGTAGGRVCLK